MQPKLKTGTMIHIKTLDNIYNEEISRYFSRELPTLITPTKSNLLEILSEILIGTKETRYGSIPKPEHLVIIREIIRKAVENDLPIPILIPWGGVKGDKTSSIDIAEFIVINKLISLDNCIKRYYPKGLYINIRIEDLGAIWLYGDSYKEKIMDYSYNFSELIIKMRGDTIIHPIHEIDLMNEELYISRSKELKHLINSYLIHSENEFNLGQGLAFDKLKAEGWKGIIPYEQRNHYIERYKALYPNLNKLDYVDMLAAYLAGSKTRYEMNGIGNPVLYTTNEMNMNDSIGIGYIQISYVQPIPGAPSTMFNNTLYYRTLPLSEARSHMPAWRAKGYLKIDSYGNIKSKITNFGDIELINKLTNATITIANSVDIKIDYITED